MKNHVATDHIDTGYAIVALWERKKENPECDVILGYGGNVRPAWAL